MSLLDVQMNAVFLNVKLDIFDRAFENIVPDAVVAVLELIRSRSGADEGRRKLFSQSCAHFDVLRAQERKDSLEKESSPGYSLLINFIDTQRPKVLRPMSKYFKFMKWIT